MINHLLNGTDDNQESHQNFDFLINNYILRQPLNKFLRSHSISNENVIIIEYIPAITFDNESQGNSYYLSTTLIFII